MALQYSVWRTAAEVANGPVLAEATVAIGGSSATSAAVVDPAGSNESRRVRLFAEAACYVHWSADGDDALNDGTRGRMFGAENPEYHEIPANWKISVIQRT